MKNKKCIAICLSAGKGKRMNTDTAKQYLLLSGKPVLYYSLKAFQDSFIDEIIIVTAKDDIDNVRQNIVEKYNLTKVTKIVSGGAERYHSVMAGIDAAMDCDYIFIHDGARPFINEDVLVRAYDTVKEYGSAIVAMPVKDTIKIIDDNKFIDSTPDRSHVWLMQTPQVFEYERISRAYKYLIENEEAVKNKGINITDDAMVMESFGLGEEKRVHVVEGNYKNIKITTPEDLVVAEAFLQKK